MEDSMFSNIKTNARRLSRAGFYVFVGTISLFSGNRPTSADPLDFKAVPVSEVVSRIDKVFNITLDVKRGIDQSRPITFSVSNPQGKSSLLLAVNSLATAINADYRKEFIISPTADGAPTAAPVIDASDSSVVFDNETQNAAKAIAIVADLDDASVRITSPLQGDVTFSQRKLSLQEAVEQISSQTHTDWNVAYVLTPHTSRTSTAGRVVGYTGEGQPIIEMPNVKFPATPSTTVTEDTPDPNVPTPEQLQDPVFRSAFIRGDVSAMLKFRPKGVPVSGPTSGN